MNIAIVLHMAENGLGITRSLGRRGIEVYGVDYQEDAEAFSSKFCRKKFVFENPITHPQECKNQLIELAKSLDNKAVLLPAADYYVSLISRFRAELADYFLFNIPRAEILDVIVNKSKQYQLAEEIGIPIPKSISPQNIDLLIQDEESLSYPVFIKGVSSHQWESEFDNKGFVVNCSRELRRYYKLAENKGIQVVIQEIVVGPNRNHFKVCAYYSKTNRILALFCTQKTRQFPIDFGIGSYMTSHNVPALIELGRRFFEGLNYTGVGSIEFKKDDKDGTFKLIELNPRLWQQNIQATYAGVNFSYINYLDCIGEMVEPSLHFRESVRYVDHIHDFMSFLGNRQRGDVSIWQWLTSVYHADCFAYFAWDDMKPAWKRLICLISDLPEKLHERTWEDTGIVYKAGEASSHF